MGTSQWKELRVWLIKHQAIDTMLKEAVDIKRLDLSGLGLQSLPDALSMLSELTVLNLANNKLSELPRTFSDLKKLNNLDLRRNRFENFPSVLGSLNLGSLNLSANSLSDVSGLADCSGLRVCDLSFNHLSSLQEGFARDNALRTLNLSGNFFKEIPQSLKELSGLERLNLSQNMLSEVSDTLGCLEDLLVINLSDNKISRIDDSFFDLGLEEIELSANALKTLHLRGLAELERLSLDENPLTSVDVEEGFAPYLKEFSCDSCQLEAFVEFGSTELEALCFSSNKISTVPQSITKYENLSQLDIDNNTISDLPYEMTNMTRLQTLYIIGNPLSDSAKEVIKILHPNICDINMKTGIVIEKAKEEDLAQMAALIGVLFEIEKDFTADFDKQLSGITKLHAYEGADLLVARYEGRVVGMVTMQRLISSAAGDYIGQIEDLIVHENYRKMGVGSRLINKIRFIALQEYGYKRVQLAADMDNTNAMSFYTRRGFRRTNLNVFHLNK